MKMTQLLQISNFRFQRKKKNTWRLYGNNMNPTGKHSILFYIQQTKHHNE
jgi:hypothetical protein